MRPLWTVSRIGNGRVFTGESSEDARREGLVVLAPETSSLIDAMPSITATLFLPPNALRGIDPQRRIQKYRYFTPSAQTKEERASEFRDARGDGIENH